jgi:hypothetical protein
MLKEMMLTGNVKITGGGLGNFLLLRRGAAGSSGCGVDAVSILNVLRSAIKFLILTASAEMSCVGRRWNKVFPCSWWLPIGIQYPFWRICFLSYYLV